MLRQPKASVFHGLNNVVDPVRLDRSWFTQADNAVITNRGAVRRTEGFVRSTTNVAVTGAYATEDQQNLYMVDSGELRRMDSALGYSVLRTGLDEAADVNFEEVAGLVFYTNGAQSGVIEPAGHRAWGIDPPIEPDVHLGTGTLPHGTYQVVCTLTDARGLESGNSATVAVTGSGSLSITEIPQVAGCTTNVYVTERDGTVFYLLRARAGATATYHAGSQLGIELPFWGCSAPRGTLPAYFQARMHIAEHVPARDYSVVWRSLPHELHHFSLDTDAFQVPGQIVMMKATAEALIIGTDRAIYAYDGEKITRLASYGALPGWHATRFNGDLYFWSKRGLCRALPFVNLTENTISVAPGVSAGGTVVEKNGERRFVVSLQKGGPPAYNQRT